MTLDTDTRDFASGLRLAPVLEFKFDSVATGEGQISGLASAFGGQPDSFGDVIQRGAFKRTLEEHRSAGTVPAMFWSHDPSAPIGRWVEVREDAKGLFVRGNLNLETTRGKDAHAHLKHRDVSGLSVGFRVAPGGRSFSSDGSALLTDLDLVEVSVVALPANLRARVTEVKSLASKRELEDLLHCAGLAKGAADRIARGGWPALLGEQEPHCILCGNTKAEASTLIKGPTACLCVGCAEETIRLSGMNERKSVDALLTRLTRARNELRNLKGN